MICARMLVKTDADNRRYLSGSLSYPLAKGAMVMLRKVTEDEFHLIALSGDGRKSDTSPESLLSFILPPEESDTA